MKRDICLALLIGVQLAYIHTTHKKAVVLTETTMSVLPSQLYCPILDIPYRSLKYQHDICSILIDCNVTLV